MLPFVKVKPVKSPERGTPVAAGIDFFVPKNFETTTIAPQESILIASGIHARIPKGKALVFMNKGGIAAKHNLDVGACVIDEDFTGEIFINLINVGKNAQTIKPDMKIVQGLLLDVDYSMPFEIGEVREGNEKMIMDENRIEVALKLLYVNLETERGNGMLGSTGR
jgi:dUTP pyrophosphatase